ncbi:MAG: bifunctional [glutamine synthetase] adenylyltransferase/[glutamine synthetase]-adenylyl-L-tyrosine phosphorylase [Kiloniellales bacterium]|nr:bifunctional [glutamine synthetase] adenylyltransferase/[glutamine synthetase]-adenylyl-L-tyrosine phosphorylase [Kiloniellales bacterium]
MSLSQDLHFLDTDSALASKADEGRVAIGYERWREGVAKLEDPDSSSLAGALANDRRGQRLLNGIFANSPFLTECALGDMGFFTSLLKLGADKAFADLMAAVDGAARERPDRRALMAALRRLRKRAALTVALADICEVWSLARVCEALSAFADAALTAAASHLILTAAERGHLGVRNPEEPLEGCGYAILGMGKLGARELNYSSDVDLIVIYDPAMIDYRGPLSVQEAFVRLTRDLVTLMEERTGDGYVARVDLRLRPDPAAMPLAIAYNTAMSYYESMGQNWERAAMIKARPVAGDLALGAEFITELRPFVWRKHLDFWAIQDVHSIKRQINAQKGSRDIGLAGHNVKLGRGGIREIEFFAQTQQLIYGGRAPELRSARTEDALRALADAGRIDPEIAIQLGESYRFLRKLEHRLQMMDDHQTHSIPKEPAGLERLAAFMGHAELAPFEREFLTHLRAVEAAYAELFEQAEPLSGPGNLVFTGGEPEAATLQSLAELGFKDGALVFNTVRAWHHGRHRATRSTRAREILTELMPKLLESLGGTVNPDGALVKFDEFLSGLPAGVQLFSLLQANPTLLELLARIMGSAPALAEHLSRKPSLLDAVLSQDFFEPVPPLPNLRGELSATLTQARDFQDVLDLTRLWAGDRKFQVGTQILRRSADVAEAGQALSDIADAVIGALAGPVAEEMARSHGRVPGPGLAVLALGKLGSREMTVSSDLDLVFLYEADPDCEASDGPKPLPVSQYFGRLAQRFINALSAATAQGRLYEIDMRLRPSGAAGPIAVSVSAFQRYHEKESWTWEQMALTRARVVSGDDGLASRIEAARLATLTRPRDPAGLLRDVAEMRDRITREHGAKSAWNVKHLRGGLVDLEFIAQYLQLRHAAERPEILDASTEAAFRKSAEAGLIGRSLAGRLIETMQLLRQVQSFLRLTCKEDFDEETAPDGLKVDLARATGCADFPALKDRVIMAAQQSAEAYFEIIEGPRGELPDPSGAGD